MALKNLQHYSPEELRLILDVLVDVHEYGQQNDREEIMGYLTQRKRTVRNRLKAVKNRE
ncbi:hypothetical protein SEA_COLT_38 [Mycobacterium phage Colt]|uniref:Uncharacterized protein n=1 Tax=Mycobacterium phage Cane17 TaxID=2301548 RepID=A0A346N8L5_9CAUD|nr:hypothetical protein KHO59_gp036 [Mycobacterium phage Cane17]AXQ51650.1 hypothetical protein SEA_CANE17_36 [Mycobacterium phage Cane17]QAY13986.1 hypothetical protein SEA_COLT_38 [Mycobacterium phage Colt]